MAHKAAGGARAISRAARRVVLTYVVMFESKFITPVEYQEGDCVRESRARRGGVGGAARTCWLAAEDGVRRTLVLRAARGPRRRARTRRD